MNVITWRLSSAWIQSFIGGRRHMGGVGGCSVNEVNTGDCCVMPY